MNKNNIIAGAALTREDMQRIKGGLEPPLFWWYCTDQEVCSYENPNLCGFFDCTYLNSNCAGPDACSA
ncbi:hypothetical protein [Dinghuibacter silviterrae]|uniref:Uncharacterized protein n=1 Tax=Dinghuibacter silviterrae TaxID=1539049 RepID=A0A4R8DMG8_9BACT|nr:hypothetical protein [Dinghuibacter silviterrae]TDW99153.1 hypothetical protein EDB95_0161 [Dinghuibacter silviterrae]